MIEATLAAAQPRPSYATVDVNNIDANQPIFFWSGFGSPILAPMEGTFVQVLAGPTRDQLKVERVSGAGVFGLAAAPGFFDAGFLILTNLAPYTPAWFQIQAWRGDSTWDRARENPSAFIGQSLIFENPTGVFEFNNVFPARLRNFSSFTIVPVPEPSVLSLLFLGGFVFYRRWCAINKP